jgi:hypothetical protein
VPGVQGCVPLLVLIAAAAAAFVVLFFVNSYDAPLENQARSVLDARHASIPAEDQCLFRNFGIDCVERGTVQRVARRPVRRSCLAGYTRFEDPVVDDGGFSLTMTSSSA